MAALCMWDSIAMCKGMQWLCSALLQGESTVSQTPLTVTVTAVQSMLFCFVTNVSINGGLKILNTAAMSLSWQQCWCCALLHVTEVVMLRIGCIITLFIAAVQTLQLIFLRRDSAASTVGRLGIITRNWTFLNLSIPNLQFSISIMDRFLTELCVFECEG